MEIIVKGRSKELKKNTVKDIVEYLGHELLGKRLANNVRVTVEFIDLPLTCYGMCDPYQFEHTQYREFVLFINKHMKKRKTLKTLIHEMVHVRQFARNQYRQFDNNVYRWNNKRLTMKAVDYLSMPWEIEANRLERPLYHECKHYLE